MTTTADVRLGIATGVYGGQAPRLLTVEGRERAAEYAATGGYAALRYPEQLLDQVEQAGLRGRGGAAFPFARKVRSVRLGAASPVVLVNGEEGEPASVKDRWLLRHRPHLVLDGARLAAAMVGAQDVYLYVSDAASADSLDEALADFPAEGWNEISIRVHRVQGSYVAGEETAAVRSINGGPALPQDKPPRPFESGIDGRPTLVSNVETLANLPVIQRLGAAGYREAGTEESPGTFLMTLSGTSSDGLYEVPFGTRLIEVLRRLGHEGDLAGLLVGGYFGGLLAPHGAELPMEYGRLADAGSGLGCGAIAVLPPTTCPVSVAAAVMEYFAHQNAGQCGSCFNGTAAMAAVLGALRDHRAEQADVDRLTRWSTDLRGRGACGTLDGAVNIAASLLREFPELVAQHLDGRCEGCAVPATGEPPFAVRTVAWTEEPA